MLTEDDRKTLLEIARGSLRSHFSGERYELPEMSETVWEERGAFVTLKKKGQLRGCIGYVQPVKPLGHAVADLAVDAAIHDPRFLPLKESELEEVDIEISAMTPLRRIGDVSEIRVGTHGLYIKRGGRAGLLLPQVAREWQWDRDQFLEHTCQKALLPPEAWKDKETEIYIFSAEVFGEKSL